MALEFILLLIAAYLIGSIPMAYLVVKYRYGVDIRRYGSHQSGATNLFRNFSKLWGLLVFFIDAGKGILLVWITSQLGMGIAQQVAVGIAVVVGHNWPIFLHFNAGRGLATTIGVAFFLLPVSIPGFLFCALFTLILGNSPLPLLVAVASLPITSALIGKPLELTLGLTLLFLMMVIRRLTAPKNERSRLVSTRELLVNRLFFDRDIKDGKAWMTFKPTEDSPDHPRKKAK